jgi:ABC-type transporter Mla subunit MlaD
VASRQDEIASALDNATGLVGDIRGAVSAAVPAIENLGNAVAAVTPARITAVVDNVERFTATLAGQSEQIEQLISAATGAATSIDSVAQAIAARREAIDAALGDAAVLAANLRAASERVPGIADQVSARLDEVGTLIRSLDAEAINGVVRDVGTFASALAEQSGALAGLVQSAGNTFARAEVVANTLAERAPQIGSAIENVEATSAAARVFAERLPGLADSLQPGIENISAVLSSIDPEAVRGIVTDARTLATSLAAQAEPIGTLVASARQVASDIEAVTQQLAQRSPQIGVIVDDVAATSAAARVFAERLPGLADSLQPGIENVSAVLSSIDPEAVRGIVTDARTLATSLAAQAEPIGNIIASARQAAADIEAITSAVAQRTPEIEALIGDASAAATAIANAGRTVDGLVTDAAPAVRQLAEAVSVITPARVDDILTNVQLVTGGLARQAPAVEALIADARAVAASARTLAATLEERAPAIGTAIDQAEAAIADVRIAAAGLPQLVTTLQPGVEAFADALSSIDAEAIRAIVANARTVSDTLAAAAPQVQAIIGRVDTASADVAEITTRLRGELDGITAGLDNAEAALASARTFADGLPQLLATVQPGAENLSAALQAIDPAAIEAIVADVRGVTGTVAALRGEIGSTITSASNAAREIERVAATVGQRTEVIGTAIQNAASFVADLAEVGPTVRQAVADVGTAASTIRETVAAIDTTAVNGIIGNVQSAAQEIGSRSAAIGAAIDSATSAARSLAEGLGTVGGEDGTIKEVLERARRIAANLEDASGKIGGVVDRASGLFDGPVQGLVADVSAAAVSVRDVAAAFASRADQIAGGLGRFSSSGLDDLRALINQGRSTLSTIERAVSNFNRDPSRVIFGGSDGPRYAPQRR